MEVQQHGNYYEDLKTRQITGLDKKTYDSLKDNGYTSGMDIMQGLFLLVTTALRLQVETW